MFLNIASPRRSFTIPININLQGARRRQTRELLHTAAAQEQEWSRGLDVWGRPQRARTQAPVSSVGEDRAILLSFAMMAFSVLMFFVVFITMVQPYVNSLYWSCSSLFSSNWEEGVRCVLLQADILEEWVDCRGVSTVPCLRVTVNLSDSNQRALLHFDEEPLLLAPECFYVPKCQTDRAELEDEVLKVKSSLDSQMGVTSSCIADPSGHPRDVILNRKYTLRIALFTLLWPGLMLGGGALLVGLVKLTQCLAHLSSGSSEAAEGRRTSRHSQGKLYRVLRRSSSQTPP
ncbi:LOW QUALITY PROTEIN: calcium-activated potassium channel subunit beta-3 [Trematomus bernacchii]|uniref:LOW QUALITY PROTEIN: calcium-activated potassium channel subunit beta-3 n=1 Tax=Trematomus bernacchii TaxID=40690 RepID=UPI00146BDC56|nr:LOW QUALITY PROTEIN: calcium-activated potassium channel subunit beta-3 [Trematomus bernacchii]